MKNTLVPFRHTIIIIAILLATLAVILPISATITRAQDMPKEVLILNSYHQGLSWSDNIVESVKATLETQVNVEVRVEYMDTRRIHNDIYLEELLNLYKLRFQN